MDSRPQTLVYKLVIAASKKVVAPTRFDAAMSLGASSDWCRFGRLVYLYYKCGKCVKSEPRITLIYMMGCDWVLVGGGVWLAGQV